MKQHIFTEMLYFLLCVGAVKNSKEAIIPLLLGMLWFNLKDKADTLETIRHCLPKSILQHTNCGEATPERVLWSIKFEMVCIISSFRDFNILTLRKISEKSFDEEACVNSKSHVTRNLLCVCVCNTY